MTNRINRFAFFLIALTVGTTCSCSRKEYVRGSQDPSFDDAAMGTGLDKRDLQKMLSENLNVLRTAAVLNEWREQKGQATLTVFPFVNETSEHIDSQLAAIASETETWLVESNTATVISRERQNQAIAQVEGSQGAAFNPARAPQYGRQLGAKYFVTGKAQASTERTEDTHRVQYFLYMQVIDVETSAIRWQHKSYVTKGIR